MMNNQLSEKELLKADENLRTKLAKKRNDANLLLIEIEEILKELININQLINEKRNANPPPNS